MFLDDEDKKANTTHQNFCLPGAFISDGEDRYSE